MSDEEAARRLLERLGRLEVVPLADDEHAQQLTRMTQAVEASLVQARSERAARRRAWLGATTLAAAAGVALLVWVHGPTSTSSHRASVLAATGAVELRSAVGSRSEVGRAGMSLEPEAELRTALESSAEVELVSGAVVAVSAKTRLHLPADAHDTLAERLELAEGRIALRVPKLASGRTLSVVTPDATVTVRGTRFSVAVEATAAHVVTSVAVEQGRVEVRSQGRSTWLSAGESWSSEPVATQSAATPAAIPVPTEPLQGPAKTATEAEGRGHAPSARVTPEEQSSLAEENALLEQALRKARGGSVNEALADLERLQRDHPRSPLTQAVRVEHFRLLLEAGQKERAAREARRYLSDYPSGFARDDAKRTALYGVEGGP